MRERGAAGRAGADRWLISYADLVTVLLAFFTALYATSIVDSAKLAPAVASLQQAIAPAPPSRLRPATARTEPTVDLYRRLARGLADAVTARRVELTEDARGLVVSLPDDATFATARAEVTPEARELLARVGDVLRGTPTAIRVEGHTDDLPIRTPKYESNWELSTARAAAVVAFLVEKAGIDAARLSAAGYGQFHPRVPNDTAQNRARNRRVDLVILDAAAHVDTADARSPGGADARP